MVVTHEANQFIFGRKKAQRTRCVDPMLSVMTTSREPVLRHDTRPISWIKAALKEFETFPDSVRSTCLAALTIAAEVAKADIAKPMRGLGSSVFEIALA